MTHSILVVLVLFLKFSGPFPFLCVQDSGWMPSHACLDSTCVVSVHWTLRSSTWWPPSWPVSVEGVARVCHFVIKYRWGHASLRRLDPAPCGSSWPSNNGEYCLQSVMVRLKLAGQKPGSAPSDEPEPARPRIVFNAYFKLLAFTCKFLQKFSASENLICRHCVDCAK